MDIDKTVEKLNNGSNLEIESSALNISKRTLQRRIKENGYIYNRTECKYFKESTNEEIEKVKNIQIEKDTNVQRTYTIKETTYKALRAKGFFENLDMSEIVDSALKNYIEEKYFNLNL